MIMEKAREMGIEEINKRDLFPLLSEEPSDLNDLILCHLIFSYKMIYHVPPDRRT